MIDFSTNMYDNCLKYIFDDMIVQKIFMNL